MVECAIFNSLILKDILEGKEMCSFIDYVRVGHKGARIGLMASCYNTLAVNTNQLWRCAGSNCASVMAKETIPIYI